jgi:hypothetical protein
MSPHLSYAQFLAQLGAMTARALEAQAQELAADSAVITERVGGGKRSKTLRIETVYLDMEPVTRPADAEKLYRVKEVE